MSGRKKSQTQVTNAMKEELLKWLCIKHATNAPLDRNILRQRANELVMHFNLIAFKCSESWLTVFLKRYSFPTNLTEGRGPIFEDYRTWVEMIRGVINQYRYEDQYHLDELSMYTDFLPSSQLQVNEVPDAPVDMSTLKLQLTTPAMHQATLLLACNATGTQKQKPLVCGPYPVLQNDKFSYVQSEDSRISDEILSAWLYVFNRNIAESGHSVILFMSRSRINVVKLVHLTHVLLLFLPYNFPSHLKPLRRDISRSIKMSYRKTYIEKLCGADESLRTPQEISESLVDAWYQVPKDLVVFQFQRTKFRDDDSSLCLECPTWENLQTGVPFERFVTFDDDLADSPVPLRDDFRFLTKVKHQFNLKTAKIDSKIASKIEIKIPGVVTSVADPEPQPSTSRGFTVNQTVIERPIDDFVGDSDDEIDEGTRNLIQSPVICRIKCETGLIFTVSSPHQQIAERIEASGVPEVPSVVPEEVDSLINCVSTEETSPDKTEDISTPVKRLFTEESGDTSPGVVTAESMDSTMIEELGSTIEDSQAEDDGNEGENLFIKQDSFVDSGVPEASGETIDGKIDDDSEGMDVDSDDSLDDPPGNTSTPKTRNLSLENSSISVLTPLINVNIDDGSSPGAALAAQFINSPYEETSEVLNTSIEGAIITAKHFVAERINYIVSNAEETPSADDVVPAGVTGDGEAAEDDDDSMDTSEASDAVDHDENIENIDKVTVNSNLAGRIQIKEEKTPEGSDSEENFVQLEGPLTDDSEEQEEIIVHSETPEVDQVTENSNLADKIQIQIQIKEENTSEGSDSEENIEQLEEHLTDDYEEQEEIIVHSETPEIQTIDKTENSEIIDKTESIGEASTVDNMDSQSSNLSLTTSETFNPPEDTDTATIETLPSKPDESEAPDNDLTTVSPIRVLNSSPVAQDYSMSDKITSYSTESALQEASRELEEKLRDLEASDPSRKIVFFDDEDTSESKQSNEAASLLHDLLNEAKELSETSEFKGFSNAKFLLGEGEPINYYKGQKRKRDEEEGEEEEGPEKKKMMSDNWAKCFETFPVFGPYNFGPEEKKNEEESFEKISEQMEVESKGKEGFFSCGEETPGPSCSYKKY